MSKPVRSRGAAVAVVLLLASVLTLIPTAASAETPTELFFSEYVEGSSNNKAIEIFNGTGADVDLSDYRVEAYNNGVPFGDGATNSLDPTGTLADGDVYVIANPSADPAILAESDVTSTVTFFNGDDALVLLKDGSVIDSFGQVGVDPGSEWAGGGQEDTLRRKVSVCAGDTDAEDPFDASDEWDSFPQNTFDGLGAHIATCEDDGGDGGDGDDDGDDGDDGEGACGEAFTPIYDIQGPFAASPLDGDDVSTEGVVTATWGATFAIQDPVGDGQPQTSDGIIVFAPGNTAAVGQAVRVTGTVDEFFDLTEITFVDAIDVCVEDAGPIAPTHVDLPLPDVAEPLERFEGMLVEFGTLYVADTFNLHRFGEVVLSGGEPLVIPTDVVSPGFAAGLLQDFNDLNQVILDDASSDQFPATVPFLRAGPTLRRGDSTEGPFVVSVSFGRKLWPAGDVTFAEGGPRPSEPAPVGGDIRVASFNVLNYFTTIDDGVNDARGADSAAELARQETKLVAAIEALDADVIGLQEIENNGPVAIGALVDALNVSAGADVWAAVPDPAYPVLPGGLEETNAIKVGIIYRTDVVTAVGDPVAGLDPIFSEDRPPVAQRFQHGAEGFWVISNHFKSKGCGGSVGLDLDQGDGQGCYNFRRTVMAERVLDLVDDLQAQSADPDILVLGDFNSYSMEDPTQGLRSELDDQIARFVPAGERYSLVFFGQEGQLDYVFTTPSVSPLVTGADVWHMSADEPRVLDYNDEEITSGESSSDVSQLYFPDVFRSSDHDPVLIGLRNRSARESIEHALARIGLLDPSGLDTKKIAKAVEELTDVLDGEVWNGDDDLHPEEGKDQLKAVEKALKELGKAGDSPALEDIAGALAAVERELAVRAIAEATAVGGEQKKLDKAVEELMKGDEEAADGEYDKAVKHYEKAWSEARKAAEKVEEARFATYNLSLNRFNQGDLIADLSTPNNSQARTVAEIIQRTDPDVILLNEFDFDADGEALGLFQENYLSVSQNGADPIEFVYGYVAPSNTGIPSGFDLNNNGSVGGPDDAFGFGFFPGQFGMAVLSKHPILYDDVRTFQTFLWKDMPGARLPDDLGTPEPDDWYSEAELGVVRLSSKSHWDVPVLVGKEIVHFLVSHPTPPVFDGPEDRNGLRNADEIRFWADYVDPKASDYIYDDTGVWGGLEKKAKFVVAGDQNSDPFDGDSVPGSAQQLLEHPLIDASVVPTSEGAVVAAAAQGGANDAHIGDPARDTADFADGAPGNLRVDYVLPSATIDPIDGAVFWPTPDDPLFPLVGNFPFPSSDHKLVWMDLDVK